MDAVQVSGHVPRFLRGVLIASVLGCLVGGVMIAARKRPGIAVLGASLVVAVASAAAIGRLARKRRWITDTGQGFTIRDRRGERSYEDEDAYRVELDARRIFSQGVCAGTRRRFRMRIEGEPREVACDNRFPLAQSDPLAPLIGRLVNAYRQRADEALSAGAIVRGANWSLTNAALTVGHRSPVTIPIEDLVSVAVLDDRVRVWRKGRDEPVFEAPERSSNAFLLRVLLEKRIGERAAADTDGEPVEGLGRIHFERKGSGVAAVLLWTVAALFVLTGTPLVLGGMVPGARILGVVLLVGAALTVWGIRVHRRIVFRCHERGVFRRGLFTATSMRYDQVETFTHTATRQYYNGAYIGTSLNIVLVPQTGTGAKTIRFSRSVKNVDESLDNLRDHIAAVVAGRMLRSVSAGERVPWTANLALRPDGIDYRPAGFVGRKDPVFLAYSQIANFSIADATFQLWEQGKAKPVVKERVGEPNFFPGYLALSSFFDR